MASSLITGTFESLWTFSSKTKLKRSCESSSDLDLMSTTVGWRVTDVGRNRYFITPQGNDTTIFSGTKLHNQVIWRYVMFEMSHFISPV